MEISSIFLIFAVFTTAAWQLLRLPLRLGAKTAIHCASGFACLWLLNTLAPFTGLTLPINPVTLLLSGTLGIPGLALVTLLELL